jgi:hypothetical protein
MSVRMGAKPEPIIAGRALPYSYIPWLWASGDDPANGSYSLLPHPLTTVKNEVEVNNFRDAWPAHIIEIGVKGILL